MAIKIHIKCEPIVKIFVNFSNSREEVLRTPLPMVVELILNNNPVPLNMGKGISRNQVQINTLHEATGRQMSNFQLTNCSATAEKPCCYLYRADHREKSSNKFYMLSQLSNEHIHRLNIVEDHPLRKP